MCIFMLRIVLTGLVLWCICDVLLYYDVLLLRFEWLGGFVLVECCELNGFYFGRCIRGENILNIYNPIIISYIESTDN